MLHLCHEFLDAFCGEFTQESHPGSVPNPFDIFKNLLLNDEVEGQCIDWLLTFLCKRGCPSYLCVVITRVVVDRVLSTVNKNVGLFSTDNGQQENGHISSDLLRQELYKELINECHSIDRQSLSIYDRVIAPQTSVHAIKNSRRKMEDKHVLLPHFGQLFKCNCVSYYAVFDGHGGVEAAQYAATHLYTMLGRHLQTVDNVKEAIRQSFLLTDKLFVDHAVQQRLMSGTTAVCALVERDVLHIAWLGDSQALIVRDGKPITLMTPHKPEREDERKRIEDLGGCVIYIGAWRVNGTLSVSRAIGDATSKPFITGEPDVTTVSYTPGDWLILACDGLWDEVSYEDAAAAVCEDNASTIAQRLVQMARDRGSADNITVLAVRLETLTGPVEEIQTTVDSKTIESCEQTKKEEGHSNADEIDYNENLTAESNTSHDRINSSTESTRLALSFKRVADASLEDCDEQRTDPGDSLSSQGSQQNVLDLSKMTRLSDIVTPRSDLSSSWATTTSDEMSRKSADTSGDAGGQSNSDSCPLRGRRRRLSEMKENRSPLNSTTGATTPPCTQHVSPRPFDDTAVLRSYKSSHSLSWASTSGPLHSAMNPGGGIKSCVDMRSRISSNACSQSNRWTIAVEVDAAGVEMFDVAAKIPPAMNMSAHW